MIKIIRSTLFLIAMMALGACSLFGSATPPTNNALLAQLPALGLTIQIQNATDTFNTVGQIINYNYVIAYTGTAPLAGPVTVADAQGPVTCPDINTVGNLNGSLDQSETVVCKSTYSITQADLNLGTITKNATASAGGVSSNQASVIATMVQTRSLALAITPNPTTFTQLGQMVTYTYTIKNSGNVTLGPTQFTITDDHIPAATNCGANTITLLPTETVTCTATYSITQADLTAGLVTNSATASVGGVGPSQPAKATINDPNVVPTIPNQPPSNFSPGSTIQHKVVAGEWLLQIARCYGASFTEVRNANLQIINPDIVSIDTIVTVPHIGSVGKVYGPPCVGTYIVQSGDTWGSIAQHYNADILVLQAANHNTLTVGTVIKVPLNSANGAIISTPTPTQTTAATPTSTSTAGTDTFRISFAQGATSSTINGTLASLGTIHYLVNGNKDQVMSVNITTTPANEVAWGVYHPSGTAIRLLDANTSWSGTLPATGDYRIDLISIGSNSSKTYSLVVSITTP